MVTAVGSMIDWRGKKLERSPQSVNFIRECKELPDWIRYRKGIYLA